MIVEFLFHPEKQGPTVKMNLYISGGYTHEKLTVHALKTSSAQRVS